MLIKVGGGEHIDWDAIASDPVLQTRDMIIVHGANAQMKALSASLGFEERMITSPSGHVSRYTDTKTMEILTMAYSGLVNKRIVAVLQKNNINAVGLTGADGRLWLGRKKDAILAKVGDKTKMITDSLTGTVVSINTHLVKLLLKENYVPVITIPAITDTGQLINVDNDRAVAVMVRDLNIEKVVMLFEAPGLLQDVADSASLISHINVSELDRHIKQTEGRMRKKLLGIKEAFINGARHVYFGDGRITNPITAATAGKGTVIE